MVTIRNEDDGDAVVTESATSPRLRRPVRYGIAPVPHDPEAPTVAFCPLDDTTEPEWGWAFVVTTYDTRTGLVIDDQPTICVPITDPDDPAPPPAPVLPEPPTLGEIWNAAHIPAPEIHTSPIAEGVTGLETWLSATGPDIVTVATEPLNGYVVTGAAHRTGYTFDFDDGPPQTSTTGGSEAEPAARHTYETKGTYALRVSSTWEATFTITGPGIPTPLPIDSATAHVQTARDYRVVEIRPVLTR